MPADKPVNRKQRRAALQGGPKTERGDTSKQARSEVERAVTSRSVALDVLTRIEHEGAYANLVLGPTLTASGLSEADRRFTTELVYGSTRMRRACDSIIDRFVSQPPDDETRSILRLGAYQLVYAGVPPHAAVGETVELAPPRTRGFVNAVLRKVAATPLDELTWPSEAARLSYPNWIVEQFTSELGDDAVPALKQMNEAPTVTSRADGYVQDPSSQWVAAAVEAQPGERILDLCAAPGGKATALASSGSIVFAADVRPRRAELVRENALRLDLELPVVVSDGTAPPFADGSFDAVLLDAPCTGLGALRRRADARWRIERADMVELAALQARLLASSAALVAQGGRLIYSVCTITAIESIDHLTPDGFEVDDRLPDVGEWRPFGQGWRVLPHDADTDGMVIIRYRRTS